MLYVLANSLHILGSKEYLDPHKCVPVIVFFSPHRMKLYQVCSRVNTRLGTVAVVCKWLIVLQNEQSVGANVNLLSSYTFCMRGNFLFEDVKWKEFPAWVDEVSCRKRLGQNLCFLMMGMMTCADHCQTHLSPSLP